MEEGIVHSISKGMPAMMVVIVVGMLIGTWMSSGAIPMMIFYGLKIISPTLYLVTACVVCSIISVVTGTSYGTAGTVGVAFIGIAQGLGIPLSHAAGSHRRRLVFWGQTLPLLRHHEPGSHRCRK